MKGESSSIATETVSPVSASSTGPSSAGSEGLEGKSIKTELLLLFLDFGSANLALAPAMEMRLKLVSSRFIFNCSSSDNSITRSPVQPWSSVIPWWCLDSHQHRQMWDPVCVPFIHSFSPMQVLLSELPAIWPSTINRSIHCWRHVTDKKSGVHVFSFSSFSFFSLIFRLVDHVFFYFVNISALPMKSPLCSPYFLPFWLPFFGSIWGERKSFFPRTTCPRNECPWRWQPWDWSYIISLLDLSPSTRFVSPGLIFDGLSINTTHSSMFILFFFFDHLEDGHLE